MVANKNTYEQLIKIGLDYTEALADFKKFRTLLKSNVEDSFKTTFDKVGENARKSVSKIFSGLSAKQLKSKPFMDFFKQVEDQISETSKVINDDFLKSVVRLNKEFNYGRKNPKGYYTELLKLADTAKEISTGSSKKLNEKIKKDASAFLEAYKNAHKFSFALSSVVSRMKSFATYFVASKIVYGFVNALKFSARAAIDLETEFANIQAITAATDEDMEKLRDTILRVGESSKYTTEEIARSTVTLGQAGLSAEEINNVLETTTQLAAATGSELSNAVDLMTSALAVWGLNSEEAAHLSDVMVTGMNRSKATLDTFRMSIQYAGATAASLNVSFEEMAAVSSAAANAGLRASVVGTGLRATMAELISPTKKMVAGLKALGLNTEDVDIASRGLIPVLKTLKNAGLDASNAYDMFGRRAATFVLATQGQIDKIDELQLAFLEQGATLKAYNKQMDTVSAQTTALGNTIKSICSDILDSISWMIKGFLKGVNKALQWVRRAFGDEDKINFEEAQGKLTGDLGATSAFGKYLNNIKEGLEKDEKAGEKLNSVIDKINTQFDKNIDHVSSTEKIADAWERISKSITEIDDEKIKELNSLKEGRSSAIVEKEISKLGWGYNDFEKSAISDEASNFLESLRSGKTVEELEKSLSQYYNNEGNKKIYSKAFEIAKGAYEGVGGFSEGSSLSKFIKDLSEAEEKRNGKGSEEGDTPLDKLNKKLKVTKTEIKETEKEIETFSAGFGNAIADMYESYTQYNLGKRLAEDLSNGISDATYAVLSGTASIKDAFADMAKSILQEISKILIKMAVLQAFGDLGFLGGNTITESGGVIASGGTVPLASGGFIPKLRAASGAKVRGGIQGRDSVPSMLMPGEYVLRKSAVDALGTNFLNDLNKNAAQTLTNTASSLVSENPWENSDNSEPAVVNVWVVSKEEEAQMGPNDVIATISKDIMVGGQTKRLIQQVVAGRK